MKLRFLVMFGFLFVLVAVGWAFYGKLAEIGTYRQEIGHIESQQQNVQNEIKEFERLLSLKDNYEYIEYLARKELGLIYPGEEKYIIVGDVE